MMKGVERAFTLIELLVVALFIAVCLGLLLPALSGARGNARELACRANLHQLGFLLYHYTTDYKDIPHAAAPDPDNRVLPLDAPLATWRCPSNAARWQNGFISAYWYIAPRYLYDDSGTAYRPWMVIQTYEMNPGRPTFWEYEVVHGGRLQVAWSGQVSKAQ
jgi:type II secretory pathway pseudopilin PulG